MNTRSTITVLSRTPFEKVEALAARIDLFVPVVVALSLAFIFAIAIVKSFYKALWFDELFSVFQAKLALAQLWSILKTGADPQPPLYFLTVRAVMRAVGNDYLGLRLPSIIGYLIFCFCLYLFIRRRTSPAYGLLGILFVSVTECWYYATEGRGYVLALACTAIAALCWQTIVMDRRRAIAIPALFASLALAINFQYYSVLVVPPFAVAALIRDIRRRKLDLAVWAAVLATPLAILPDVSFLRQSTAKLGSYSYFWARPAWFNSFVEFSKEFLWAAVLPVCAVTVLFFIWETVARQRQYDEPPDGGDSAPLVSFPEAPLIVLLTCVLPLSAIAVGKLFTHVLLPRYIMETMFGVSVLFCWVAWYAFRASRLLALASCVVFGVFFAHFAFFDLLQAQDKGSVTSRLLADIPKSARSDNLPIVTVVKDTPLEMHYYLPNMFNRLYFLSDKDAEERYLGYTQIWWAVVASAPYFGTQVVDYHEFINSHGVFYVLAPNYPGRPGWIIPELVKVGATVTVMLGGPLPSPGAQGAMFFKVTMPHAAVPGTK